MQPKSKSAKKIDGTNLNIAIVQSKYNGEYGDDLLFNTVETLKKNGVKKIRIEKVPGALELPFAVKQLCTEKKFDAIIALGIIIKGDTYHFELVCNECYRGLMGISCNYDTPIIFGVISAYNSKQVADRCNPKKHNKGEEFAIAAIDMALLNKKI